MRIRKWMWAILGVVSLAIRWGAYHYPEATDWVYSRSIFPVIRSVMDLTIVKFPFPAFYLFLLIILGFFGRYLFRLRKYRAWKGRLLYSARAVSNFVGAIVFFFLVLWGYNYQRVPFVHQLQLVTQPFAEAQLLEEIKETEEILSAARSEITTDSSALGERVPYEEVENLVREEIKRALSEFGFYHGGFPRTKEFYPAGMLRRLGIIGIYFPFTGESYLDPTLHPLEKPFTVAHEMAHSYGITDEGEANFLGWLVCSGSDAPLLRYAGHLQLFRYQLNDLYKVNPEKYLEVIQTIDRGIINDIAAIRENSRKIEAISSELSRKSNDLFLKSQGVRAGVKSYSQLPMLAYAWKQQYR